MEGGKSEHVVPLSAKQQRVLVDLVAERASVIQNKSQDSKVSNKKRKIWEEIAVTFNARNPGQEPHGAQQLKRSWDHIKRRVKNEESSYKKRLKATGGGPPPSPPRMSEVMSAAAILMGQELAMNDTPYDSLGLHPADEDGTTVTSATLEFIDLRQQGPSTSHIQFPGTSLSSHQLPGSSLSSHQLPGTSLLPHLPPNPPICYPPFTFPSSNFSFSSSNPFLQSIASSSTASSTDPFLWPKMTPCLPYESHQTHLTSSVLSSTPSISTMPPTPSPTIVPPTPSPSTLPPTPSPLPLIPSFSTLPPVSSLSFLSPTPSPLTLPPTPSPPIVLPTRSSSVLSHTLSAPSSSSSCIISTPIFHITSSTPISSPSVLPPSCIPSTQSTATPSTAAQDSQRGRRRRSAQDEAFERASQSQDEWLALKRRRLEEEHQAKMHLIQSAEQMVQEARDKMREITGSYSGMLDAGREAYTSLAYAYRCIAESVKKNIGEEGK